jgi:pimeloyl-ACP methyl ester carboxylesterase
VALQQFQPSWSYSGEIRPDTEVQLAFKEPGYIASLYCVKGADGQMRELQVGDQVPAGAVLAHLRRSDYEASFDSAVGQEHSMQDALILVSHAYGGAVITQGGDDPKVKALIYAGSPMPGIGESANDCLVRFPGGDFASSVELTPYTLPDGTSGTDVHVKADKYCYLVAADVPESVVDLMITTQRPISLAALNEKLTSAAWVNKPSWQIRPMLDPVIPVEEFKFEADRAHSRVIELNSSHAIPITFPDIVVDVIEQAVRATTE